MLRGATNLKMAESFQPCIVGEDVTAKSCRQLLFLYHKRNDGRMGKGFEEQIESAPPLKVDCASRLSWL